MPVTRTGGGAGGEGSVPALRTRNGGGGGGGSWTRPIRGGGGAPTSCSTTDDTTSDLFSGVVDQAYELSTSCVGTRPILVTGPILGTGPILVIVSRDTAPVTVATELSFLTTTVVVSFGNVCVVLFTPFKVPLNSSRSPNAAGALVIRWTRSLSSHSHFVTTSSPVAVAGDLGVLGDSGNDPAVSCHSSSQEASEESSEVSESSS